MKMINYIERRLNVRTPAMDLLLSIARSGLTENYTIYEQPDEWSIALGQFATLRASQDTVTLKYADQYQQFQKPRLCQSIAEATAALPLADWRLYGTAHFELSHVFHHVEQQKNRTVDTLLELFVPQYEIRIKHGQALLRALNADHLEALTALFIRLDAQPTAHTHATETLSTTDHASHHQAQYKKAVQDAVADIQAHQYQKVILSRRIPLPGNVDVIDSYRAGRLQNTPARSFLLRQGEYMAAGFSPETVVEVAADNWVSTQPLAGTRAIGANAIEEARLKAELLADTKEIAEHAVSVKLALEELQSVCRSETLSVSEFMAIRRRGSVQHLASRVRGQLESGRNSWDAFEALFPAVTASGIPKKPAIEAIQRYEPQTRDLYSGCVMIVESTGAMDAALVLRSIYSQGNQQWLQAGAGIVDQSKPERELEETIEKLTCIMTHLVGPAAQSAPEMPQETELETV